MFIYDVIVVGGGHAGCEAALVAARMGARVLLVTRHANAVGQMPCNPAIGGLAKSHLVFELDALGGEMAVNTDATGLQWRVLNTSRGPAVRANRAQCDKAEYSRRMAQVLAETPGLTVVEDEVTGLLFETNPTRRHADAPTCRIANAPTRRHADAPKNLPMALRRRAVRAWLLEHAGAEAAGFEVVERVLKMFEKKRGRLSVPGGEIVFEKDEIVFLKNERTRASALRCALPGETQWGDVRVTLCHAEGIVRKRGRVGELPAEASFSADALEGREVIVRSWRAGDRIRELGMKGHKKLQDIFTDAKVPFWQRSDIPVFCCDDEVIWLPGCRVAAKYAVKDEKRAVRITVK